MQNNSGNTSLSPLLPPVKQDLQIWTCQDTGKARILDPNGTLYDCDAAGYKKPNFIPRITGISTYRVRVKQSILDRVSKTINANIIIE